MNQYFGNLPSEAIGSEILEKVQEYYEYVRACGRLSLWRRSYEAYYRQHYQGGETYRAGEQGEIHKVSVNQYRNLVQHVMTLVTQQRIAFDCRSTNTDYESISQTILGNALLDYYNREKRMERYLKKALEFALLYDQGYVFCGWNASEGETFGTNEFGIAIKEGDVEFAVYSPMDVVKDVTKRSSKDNDWYITRTSINRFDLVAKYPELEERILALPKSTDMEERLSSYRTIPTDGNDVNLWRFYHGRTLAVPEGRETHALEDGTVILDGPLPYKKVPIFLVQPSEQDDSPFGYTSFYDVLPLQEAYNDLHSIILTNQRTFGVQNIISERGANISFEQVTDGLNFIEIAKGFSAPSALQLTSTPGEIFNYLGMLDQIMETMTGVNSVARGNPEASLKSGAAVAFVQAMAVQFQRELEASYVYLSEDVGTQVVQLLQQYAAVPRVALIAGKSNRSLVKEFSAKDLDKISRVQVDVGNPLTKTLAGKVNTADMLLEKGMIKSPEQYLQVLNSGKLEPVIEADQAQLMLIRAENEDLSEGQPVEALLTDNHLLHINEHSVVLASPESRKNPELVNAVLAHIQEHIDILHSQDPMVQQLLMTIGQQPMGQAPQGEAPLGDSLSAEPPLMNEMPNDPSLPNPPAGTDPMAQETMGQQQAVLSQ